MRLRLNQKAVYWAPVAADAFGRPTWDLPVEFLVRWEDKFQEIIDGTGETTMSSATVYTDETVLVGGLFMLGPIDIVVGSGFPTNPKADRRVHEILSIGSVPNLKGTQTLTTVSLR